MVKWTNYGRDTDLKYPDDLDFVVVTNEDLGFTSDLTIATLNHLNTSLPYPQEWDPDTEVCTLYKLMGSIYDRHNISDDAGQGLAVNLSYLDRNPAGATYAGIGQDTEDEYHKSVFEHGMYAGVRRVWPSAAAAVEVMKVPVGSDAQEGFKYRPEIPLSMFFPIYMDIYGQSQTYALATGNETAIDFSAQESFVLKYYYNIRRMNRSERNLMEALSGAPVRWAQLGS